MRMIRDAGGFKSRRILRPNARCSGGLSARTFLSRRPHHCLRTPSGTVECWEFRACTRRFELNAPIHRAVPRRRPPMMRRFLEYARPCRPKDERHHLLFTSDDALRMAQQQRRPRASAGRPVDRCRKLCARRDRHGGSVFTRLPAYRKGKGPDRYLKCLPATAGPRVPPMLRRWSTAANSP